MSKASLIILLEDDEEDQELFREVLVEIGYSNPIKCFANGEEAFDFLKTTDEQPFLILSDVNLPRMNGIEFKRKVDNDSELRARAIPFVFFSTSIDKNAVDEAYHNLTVQGFFQKPHNFRELKSTIKLIIDYWKICRHPNSS
jgi:CheY-like chemotaxis protein